MGIDRLLSPAFVLLQIFSKEPPLHWILLSFPQPYNPLQPEILKMPLACFKPGKNADNESGLDTSASARAERQDRPSADGGRGSGSDRVPELPTNAQLSVRGRRPGTFYLSQLCFLPSPTNLLCFPSEGMQTQIRKERTKLRSDLCI